MPVRRYRFILLAGIAALALLAAGARDALAQQGGAGLSKIRDLDFGSFVAGNGGTVAVASGGLRTRTGAVVLLNSPGAGQAGFNLSRNGGSNNKTLANISLPPNGTVRLTSGANSMAVDNFVSSPATGTSMPSGGTLSVGATLTVAPNQAPGTYSGSFSVTVIYQ